MTDDLERWMFDHENTLPLHLHRVNNGRFVISGLGRHDTPCVVDTLADLHLWLDEFYRLAGFMRRNEYNARTVRV